MGISRSWVALDITNELQRRTERKRVNRQRGNCVSPKHPNISFQRDSVSTPDLRRKKQYLILLAVVLSSFKIQKKKKSFAACFSLQALVRTLKLSQIAYFSYRLFMKLIKIKVIIDIFQLVFSFVHDTVC